MRLLTLLFAWGLLTGPAFGQTADEASAPTEYTFRFVADNDMFYIPWNGNGEELERLLACIAGNRTVIADGTVPVLVDGYCTSQATADENLAMAKTRSNRVKTELILRGGLTEACFTTHNHTSGGNLVTVRIVIPPAPAPEPAPQPVPEQPEPAKQPEQPESAEQPVEQPAPQPAPVQSAPTTESVSDRASGLALRANLLRWATLTPDLGVEWRINSRWSLGVNGTWTSWSWNDKQRRYALWEVAPEVRYYMGKARRGYLGLLFKTGAFNYKFSETGRQGDLLGGGLTGGYQLRLNKALNLDFNLGLGYLNADYEKYEVIDGVRVRRGNEIKDWWGPINAGVTLVWKLF